MANFWRSARGRYLLGHLNEDIAHFENEDRFGGVWWPGLRGGVVEMPRNLNAHKTSSKRLQNPSTLPRELRLTENTSTVALAVVSART